MCVEIVIVKWFDVVRFWGWMENDREATRWANDPAALQKETSKAWGDLDW